MPDIVFVECKLSGFPDESKVLHIPESGALEKIPYAWDDKYAIHNILYNGNHIDVVIERDMKQTKYYMLGKVWDLEREMKEMSKRRYPCQYGELKELSMFVPRGKYTRVGKKLGVSGENNLYNDRISTWAHETAGIKLASDPFNKAIYDYWTYYKSMGIHPSNVQGSEPLPVPREYPAVYTNRATLLWVEERHEWIAYEETWLTKPEYTSMCGPDYSVYLEGPWSLDISHSKALLTAYNNSEISVAKAARTSPEVLGKSSKIKNL